MAAMPVSNLQRRLVHLVREARLSNVVLSHLRPGVAHAQAQEHQVHTVLDAHQAITMAQAVERNACGQSRSPAETLHL
jgi:hypothetical protein